MHNNYALNYSEYHAMRYGRLAVELMKLGIINLAQSYLCLTHIKWTM